MKPNDRLLIFATAAFSYLFYQQNAGINFLVFNLVLTGMLLFKNKSLIRNKTWLLAFFMCLTSATGIVVHSSALAVIANIFSLLLLSAFSFSTSSSTIFSLAFSCYSVVTSFVYAIIDASERSAKNEEDVGGVLKAYRFFTVFIVLLLCILFFALYRQSNPLFAENTQWVNFDFISFPWLVFTVAGFFIVYGLFYHRTIVQVEGWERNLPFYSGERSPERERTNQAELSAGVLLFVFLNLMLIFLNAGDINTIWFEGILPKGTSHSDFVHNGVSLIILSILIATGLIMFLFRKNFRSLKNAQLLKLLVYAWILQNLIMLFSTAARNQIYISDYNLTYRRVGVYVWLLLAAIGLLITFFRVYRERSNWFLIRSNFSVWFGFLVLSSTVNWDLMITRYNLNNKPLKEVDFYYLFSLSESTIPDLLEVSRNKDFHQVNGELRTYANSSAYEHHSATFRHLMKRKVRHYLGEYKSDWQSWDLRDKRIMENLIKR